MPAYPYSRSGSSRRAIFFAPGRFRLPWILISVALFASLIGLVMRWKFENTFVTAQLTVDYNDTRALADAYRVPQESFLRELKDAGATSLAVYQQTVFSLRDAGRLTVTSRESAQTLYPRANWEKVPAAYRYVITFGSDARGLQAQVMTRLKAQASPDRLPRLLDLNAPGSRLLPRGILVPASNQLLSDASMGFDPSHLALAKRVGLTPTARLSNALNTNLQRAELALDDAKRIGARAVLFSEDEVLGYESLMAPVSRAMRERGLVFGTIEFSKQRGNEDFAKSTEGLIVRVHSVTGDEAAKTKRELLLDRYVRAVKERDIRIGYIRLFRQFKGEYEPVQSLRDRPVIAKNDRNEALTARRQNLDLVRDIAQELSTPPVPIPGLGWLRPPMTLGVADGFGTRDKGKFLEYPNNYLQPTFGELGAKVIATLLRFATGLGVVGGVLLMLHLFFDLSPRASRNLLWFGLLLALALSPFRGKGAQILALGAGVIFSFIGIMWGGLPEIWSRGRRGEGDIDVKSAFKTGFGVLVQTTLLTSIGGFLVISFLNGWQYMSKANEFLGEKATLTLPMLLVALAFAGEAFPHRVAREGATPARERGLRRFRNLTERPFTIGLVLSVGAFLLAAYIFIARTGNESGMEISGLELSLRATLERVFITRPRTKEILIGNPAMIFAVWFALRKQWLPALIATVPVAMGQADIVNTLCHIHTPLFFSIWRTIIGVILGGLLGGALLWLWARIEREARTPRVPPLSRDEDAREHNIFDDALNGNGQRKSGKAVARG